jgi:hypothetical protein
VIPLSVGCPHCHVLAGAVCLAPADPGKGLASRRPLRFSVAHPQRIAVAAAMAAGASGAEALRAARVVCVSDRIDYAVPYVAEAKAGIDRFAAEAVGRYRELHPQRSAP